MVVVYEDDDGTKGATIAQTNEVMDGVIEDAQTRLDAVWDKIFETAIMLCPIDTGTLVQTIRIEKGFGQGESGVEGADIESFSTPAAGGSIKSVIVYDSTIIAGDENVFKPNGQPCIYASWVHDGHYSQAGQWVEGQPFLEEAIMEHIDELDEAVQQALESQGVTP